MACPGNWALSKVNPRFAHSFAIMKGKLAKTDAIDATNAGTLRSHGAAAPS